MCPPRQWWGIAATQLQAEVVCPVLQTACGEASDSVSITSGTLMEATPTLLISSCSASLPSRLRKTSSLK